MKTLCAAAAALLIASAAGPPLEVSAQGEARDIWSGIYTDAQAERGKAVYAEACVRCHGSDLKGTTAPALTGEPFMKVWGGEPIERLYVKIRDTMPPSFGTILDDSAKIDIVSYILQTGGYPSGPSELRVGRELAAVQILRKGEKPTAQNFSLVQAVGCLARGDGNAWTLTSASEPAVTRDDKPPADALTAAATAPLGSGTFLLLSVVPFNPAAHVGQKMEARGLVYREPGDARITLTSLQPTGAPCAA